MSLMDRSFESGVLDDIHRHGHINFVDAMNRNRPNCKSAKNWPLEPYGIERVASG